MTNRLIFVILTAVCFNIANCLNTTGASEHLTEVDEWLATTTKAELPDSLVTAGSNNTGWVEDWTPSERLKKWFPVYRLGVDNGVPCALLQFQSLESRKSLFTV